jgi:hypothetical protein
MDVTLREMTLEDVSILFEHQRDPVAAGMAAFPSRDWDAFVAHDAKLRVDPTVIRRTIVADGEVVGGIGVFGEDEREVWYWIDWAAWGKGIASAALGRAARPGAGAAAHGARRRAQRRLDAGARTERVRRDRPGAGGRRRHGRVPAGLGFRAPSASML